MAKRDQAASERKRFESARAGWKEEPKTAEPPFDINAAKERIVVLWTSMSRLDQRKSEEAAEAGDLLIKMKDALPHGKFTAWIEANLPFSADKARDLMNHAKAYAGAKALGQDLPPYAPSQTGHGARFGSPGSLDDWQTPLWVIEAARATMKGIDCDPATCKEWNEETVHAPTFYTKEISGLDHDHPWIGRVWCNPPWSRSGEFVVKLLAEYGSRRVTSAILLVNGISMLSKWFAPLWFQPICFAKIPFKPPKGKEKLTTPFSVLAYFGNEKAAFFEHFAAHGPIVLQNSLGFDPIFDAFLAASVPEAKDDEEE